MTVKADAAPGTSPVGVAACPEARHAIGTVLKFRSIPVMAER
jgi:hypothetical protein